MMMSLRLTPPLFLLFLLMISGVAAGVAVSQDWDVYYTPKSICALKGSTVTMGCRYTYPAGYTFERGIWSRELVTDKEPPDLTSDPKYRGRVQYLGDKPRDCSLRLSDVREQDQGKYYFRFLTTFAGGKYQGQDGVDLSVTELEVQIPDRVIEGDAVTLTCKTRNRLSGNTTLIWYRSGRRLSSSTNLLRLPSVRQSDVGRYSCAVQDSQSCDVTLEVQYPPKRVSVSIRPSGKIVEGRSVTLTCSSDAKPPAQNYTWYKGASYIRRGKTYTIYTISSEDSGNYTCRAGNEHGQQSSTAVSLNVLSSPKRVSVSISPSGEIVEGSSVTLTCSSDANPPVHTYTWHKGTSYIGTGNTYTINKISSEDSGEYKCKSSNQYGEKYSDGATLNVLYPPKNVSVSISHSSEIVEGSSVTLTCSSDANPPVEYSWFKGTSYKSNGKTYTFRKISSEDSGPYKCKSSNQYGAKYSDEVTIKVLYPPKRVSVSISPSGEIVEGSSVTLTCSSDANPPVESYNWYKGTSSIGTGKTYTIYTISTEDSGEYKCNVRNRYGEKYSDGVTLNILYPPKRVSVSISPSGEIVEGSSVTLTCSSDANPPVQTYTWFKGTSYIGTGQSYIINRISSEDSGDYKCKSSNQHGEKYTDGVTLNVLYPPKNVSVSISRSGEIVEGSDSVTLTCSSDANPPVHDYTWYKVDESSPVGSGQSYSFTLRFNSSGWFYCVAQNKYGNQTAAAVALTLNGGTSVVLYVVLGVTVGCGCLFAIIGVLCMRRKRRGGSTHHTKSNENIYCSPTEDTYTALDLQCRSSKDVYDTLATVHPSSPDDTYTAMDS
ncbi:B-cell receptor CD22-like isoform X2 [Pangasianodon hypophthalmus]|uniref:B-cell receptor CD22-like isoform X2 n=1 Tax=Pangasianodon hypophthalmus TaxID=310915 RepID=UPI002306E64D|nr:B-cell receptor CD22-like isoform X2 [Pangasianodon hypophthalmus]